MNYKCPVLLLILAVFLYYFLSPPSPLSDKQLTEHLNNKVVLICGASSGIGEELAYQLAPHGTKLVLVARSQDKLDNVRLEVIKRGAAEENVLVISFDFSDVSRTKEVVDKTVEKFEGLDYLVSNHANLASGPILSIPELQDPDTIETIFRTNLFSHIQLAFHALPHLEKRKGHMFFTTSILGEIPLYVTSIYSSTKHAMNGFFYSLQQELLARGSPVSLTIGSFGLIQTKAVMEIMSEGGGPFYYWTVGSVEDCARVMMEAYVTRPYTSTFTWQTGLVYRSLWYFPWSGFYHQEFIRKVKLYLQESN